MERCTQCLIGMVTLFAILEKANSVNKQLDECFLK